jgi:alpha-beta hydrolase superfamily lysophospholipase
MDHSRRAVIAGAGAGLATALVANEADAQGTVDAELLKKNVTSIAIRAPLESAEYWAQKGDVKLYLYRKRIAPSASAPGQTRPVLFLVHGSSNSARSSYDLAVPGKGEYSMMNVFAHYGFDVWTMDHDGYGRSGSSGNSSDIASGVADLKAAMPVVWQETGAQKLHLYGTSSGAIRAGAYAQAAPERVERLVL